MTTIPSIEPATCSPAAGAPHVDAAASLPPVGPRAYASEPLRSLHAAALPFAQLLADNAILQSVLESIVAAPLSPTPSPERSVEASAPPALAVPSAPPTLVVPSAPPTLAVPSAPPTLAVPSAPPTLVGGDVLGAPRPGAEVPPAESSSVVSPVVSTRLDAAVEDGSSVAAFAARRGRRALPSEGAVPGAVPSVPSAPSVPSTTSAPPTLSAPPVPPASAPSAPSTLVGGVQKAVPSVPSAPSVPSTTSAPPALSAPPVPPTLAVPSAPPTLVGGDVLGAPRPGAEVPPAESSPVVSPGVPVRPDAAVVDESSVVAFAARRGRRALSSEGAVQKAASPASSAPSAPSASSAPPTPSALPVSLAVPEVSAPAAAPTAAPVTAVEAVVAAFTPSAARAVEPAQVLVEAARAVADTLLVTPGLLRGEGEIRIQLRPDVLDGTEIRIAVAGRQLTVAFTPPTPDLVALIEQSRPQLTAHLAERIHSFQIAVDVRRRVRSEERG